MSCLRRDDGGAEASKAATSIFEVSGFFVGPSVLQEG
jgi:hypothetical protein